MMIKKIIASAAAAAIALGVFAGLPVYAEDNTTLSIAAEADGTELSLIGAEDYTNTYAAKKTTKKKSTKLAAPKGITATSTETTITLKWNKVKGAKAYRVYKYNMVTGKYEKYKDVKTTKCTVKNLYKDAKYSFKICTLTTKNGKYVKQKTSGAFSWATEGGFDFGDEK